MFKETSSRFFPTSIYNLQYLVTDIGRITVEDRGGRYGKYRLGLVVRAGPSYLDCASSVPVRWRAAARLPVMLSQVLISVLLMAGIYAIFMLVVREG